MACQHGCSSLHRKSVGKFMAKIYHALIRVSECVYARERHFKLQPTCIGCIEFMYRISGEREKFASYPKTLVSKMKHPIQFQQLSCFVFILLIVVAYQQYRKLFRKQIHSFFSLLIQRMQSIFRQLSRPVNWMLPFYRVKMPILHATQPNPFIGNFL